MPRSPEGYGSDPHRPGCQCGLHVTNQYGHKGNQVGNTGKHIRVRKARGYARDHKCVDCGEPAKEWSMIHGRSGLSADDFDPRCYSCHKIYDRIGAVLTPDKVREIKALYADASLGHTWSSLAKMFGVTKRSIGNIVNGVTWTHVS